jgi:hypothetical protein
MLADMLPRSACGRFERFLQSSLQQEFKYTGFSDKNQRRNRGNR